MPHLFMLAAVARAPRISAGQASLHCTQGRLNPGNLAPPLWFLRTALLDELHLGLPPRLHHAPEQHSWSTAHVRSGDGSGSVVHAPFPLY